MKKRRVWLRLVVLAVVGIGLASWLRRPVEPSYQGMRLSEWLQQYDVSYMAPPNTNADAAMRAMGTNALPFLVNELASSNPKRLQGVLLSAGNRVFCDWLHLRKEPWSDPREDRAWQAAAGLAALGPSASTAAPALVGLLAKPDVTCSAAAGALADIGLPAVPALVQALTNRSVAVRINALRAVAGMRCKVGAALPAVLACLHDTNMVSRRTVLSQAIRALGNMHDRPLEASSALTNFLKEQNPLVRVNALWSLGRLGPDARLSLPVITNALTGPDLDVRNYATNTLSAIAALPLGTDLDR